jgi:hypothetical protein
MATTPSSPGAAHARPIGPLAALRHYDFRLLGLGNLISIAGSQMRIIAVNYSF